MFSFQQHQDIYDHSPLQFDVELMYRCLANIQLQICGRSSGTPRGTRPIRVSANRNKVLTDRLEEPLLDKTFFVCRLTLGNVFLLNATGTPSSL